MTLATHHIRRSVARRARLLLLASVFTAAASPAFAQSDPVEPADEPQDIVITGSMVERSGFDTPTPVTVIGMDAIERVAAPSIADVINQMPAVRPSLTPTSAVNAGGNTQTGGNFLDLRGLGYARTMVLLDGRRYVPTNPTGAVSINNIPQALIDRVDIVTGGASAAYGADAVAGVVNLRINSKMQGVRATLQGGMAEEGDYRQILASVAAGTKVTDRLHLVVGGGHPDYVVREDPNTENPDAPRAVHQQDLWNYTLARMVDACVTFGLLPFYGPFGDFSDGAACEAQFRNAFLLGCAGAWSLHPTQIEIAKRVFSPDPNEVAFAKKVLDAMPDGTGAVMIDGKMQDDATWKQAKVVVDLARIVAAKDPDLAARYGL